MHNNPSFRTPDGCPVPVATRWTVRFTKSGKIAKLANTRGEARDYRRFENRRTYIFDELTGNVVR